MKVLTYLRQLPVWILCCILYFVVVVGRLSYSANHIVFSQDQARDALYMEQLAASQNWLVAYGPKASVGDFYLPPLYYQLHLIVSAVTGFPPLIMQWLITIVEAATPVLIFLILRRFTSQVWAFSCAALYGYFVIPFYFATFAWNPNMIPFFSTLAVLSWVELHRKGSPWWSVVGILSVTVAVHLHYQSVVLLPFAALMMSLDVRSNFKNIRYWLIGATLALITLLPYFATELQNNWHNTRTIIHYFTSEHSQYYDRVSKPEYVLSFLPGFVERMILGVNTDRLWIGRILFGLGFAAAFLASLKKDLRAAPIRLTLAYFLVLFIVLRFYKGDKLDYYLSTLFILPAVLLAYCSRWLPKFLIVVLFPLTFLAVQKLQTAPNFNGYAELGVMTRYITETVPDSQFGLLFHDDDAINFFAYSLQRQTTHQIKTGSQYLVEICAVGGECPAYGKLFCHTSRAVTYSELLKTKGTYSFVTASTYYDRYTISIGTLSQTVESVGYPAFDTRYGSDLMVTGVYTQ